MRTTFGTWDLRRLAPRLTTDALCSEVVDGRSRLGFAVELSPDGVRLERPFRGGPRPREVELEFSLPGEDDVLFAGAEVRFDEVRPAPRGSALAAAGGLIRVTGLWLARLASRDRRLLRDFVMDHRAIEPAPPALSTRRDDLPPAGSTPALLPDLGLASCYARG